MDTRRIPAVIRGRKRIPLSYPSPRVSDFRRVSPDRLEW